MLNAILFFIPSPRRVYLPKELDDKVVYTKSTRFVTNNSKTLKENAEKKLKRLKLVKMVCRD
jgi:hypothetical protein